MRFAYFLPPLPRPMASVDGGTMPFNRRYWNTPANRTKPTSAKVGKLPHAAPRTRGAKDPKCPRHLDRTGSVKHANAESLIASDCQHAGWRHACGVQERVKILCGRTHPRAALAGTIDDAHAPANLNGSTNLRRTADGPFRCPICSKSNELRRPG